MNYKVKCLWMGKYLNANGTANLTPTEFKTLNEAIVAKNLHSKMWPDHECIIETELDMNLYDDKQKLINSVEPNHDDDVHEHGHLAGPEWVFGKMQSRVGHGGLVTRLVVHDSNIYAVHSHE